MISVREACEEDCALLVELIRELAVYEKLEHEVTATPEILRESLFGTPARAHALLVETDGMTAGFCIYFYNFSTFLGRPGLYIEDIYVRPELRGRGIGKNVFEHLKVIARAQGCGRIEWWVLDWNQPAVEFYRKLGAEPMSDWTVHRLDESRF